MKNLMQVGLMLSLLSLASCQGGETASQENPLAGRFNQQLVASCLSGMGYYKAVSDLDDPTHDQDTLYQPMPEITWGERADGEDSLSYLLVRDLQYAVESYYADPATLENMELSESGDTLTAAVRPEYARKAKLLLQRVTFSADSSHLLYIRTRQQERSWLYTIETDIWVKFDSVGTYLAHDLFVTTEVPLLGRSLRLRTQGEGRPIQR